VATFFVRSGLFEKPKFRSFTYTIDLLGGAIFRRALGLIPGVSFSRPPCVVHSNHVWHDTLLLCRHGLVRGKVVLCDDLFCLWCRMGKKKKSKYDLRKEALNKSYAANKAAESGAWLSSCIPPPLSTLCSCSAPDCGHGHLCYGHVSFASIRYASYHWLPVRSVSFLRVSSCHHLFLR
jgi:hypothetical protein